MSYGTAALIKRKVTINMSRMRTINQAIDYIHECDNKTALTKYALRRLIANGTIPSIQVGNKYLINLDILDVFLASTTESSNSLVPTSNHDIEV